ncbi:MAG: hypothetical protein ACRD3H_10965 [Terriglobales bacterium]
MNCGHRYLSSLLLAAAFLVPVVTTACGGRPYRAYDPYYNDYHRWDNHENVYYHQWVVENHRPDRDFRRLDKGEQKQYWTWRHSHNDDHGHDHDHDHDHDRH